MYYLELNLHSNDSQPQFQLSEIPSDSGETCKLLSAINEMPEDSIFNVVLTVLFKNTNVM